MKCKYLAPLALSLSLSLTLSGCTTPQVAQKTNQPFTPGHVTLTLKKGETTKQEVLQAFGQPNIVTQTSSEGEVWTYQKASTISKKSSSGSFITILLAGSSNDQEEASESQRTMTLIIHFNEKGVVTNFKSMYTSF